MTMTIEEIEKIRSDDLHNIIDLDECEQDFEITSIFKDATINNNFILDLQRGNRKYFLFILGNEWECHLRDDEGFSYLSTPEYTGTIETMRYRDVTNGIF